MRLTIYSILLTFILSFYIYKTSIRSLGPESILPNELNFAVPRRVNAPLDSSPNKIFYFIHISDLHISKFSKRGGLEHLKLFLKNLLPMISPQLVVVTGDLTDAKSRWKISSRQFEREWKEYKDALEASNVYRDDFWLDLRGNHDCFDVPGFNHSSNFYNAYSSVKQEGFSRMVKKEFGNYQFVAVDGCPRYGTRRPLNFFGYLDSQDLDFIESTSTISVNHTFLLSHYPSGTLVKGTSLKGSNFEKATRHVSIWLSGHLHKLIGGLGNTMYSNVQDKFLELELGDLKTSAMYRIIAVDSDFISFVDHDLFNPNPIVLITNPKDGRFVISHKEPKATQFSDYIRVLIWSSNKIVKLDAYLDGLPISDEKRKWKYSGKGKMGDNGNYIPLWTLVWDKRGLLDKGNKTLVLTVNATDEMGQAGTHSIHFRIDGEFIPEMNAGSGGFIISLNFDKIFKSLFIVSYMTFTFGLLLIPKIWTIIYPSWRSQSLNWVFYHLCLSSQDNTSFFTFYFYSLYILIGPWFVGDFVPSSLDHRKRWGLYFVYGILFMDGTWIPILDSWAYAFYTLAFSIIPLYLYIALGHSPSRLTRKWYIILFVIGNWLYASSDIIFMTFYYGKWASILSPGRTWILFWILSRLIRIWSVGKVHVDSQESEPLSSKQEIKSKGYDLRSRK